MTALECINIVDKCLLVLFNIITDWPLGRFSLKVAMSVCLRVCVGELAGGRSVAVGGGERGQVTGDR